MLAALRQLPMPTDRGVLSRIRQIWRIAERRNVPSLWRSDADGTLRVISTVTGFGGIAGSSADSEPATPSCSKPTSD